jgi:ABC-2 type transport system permease protein
VIDLLAAEVLKLRSTRTALGLFVAALVVSVVPAALIVALAPVEFLQDEAAGIVMVGGVSLVPLLGLVFGVLSMTNEYRHGTITYSYLSTPRRGQLIVVKLIVCGVAGASAMALAMALAAATVAIGFAIRGVPLDVPEVSTVDAAEYLVLVVVAAGLMASFGVGLGALLRNQPVTVAGTLIWALAIEGIVVALRPGVGQYLPFTAFEQVVGGSLGGEGMELGLSRPEAFFVSLAYIVVVSLAAVYTSMRRDVT